MAKRDLPIINTNEQEEHNKVPNQEGETNDTPKVEEGETNDTPKVEEGETNDTPKVEEGETKISQTTDTKNNMPKKKQPLVKGEVIGCSLLRIRSKPNTKSEILKTIPKNTKVVVDLNQSTTDFYHVNFEGTIGFCVKTFIEIEM